MLSFVEFSNKIVETNDIDPYYILFKNFKSKYGETAVTELFKLNLVTFDCQSELLYLDGHIKSDKVKLHGVAELNRRHWDKWYNGLKKVDFEKLKKFHGVSYEIFRREFTKLQGMGDRACWKAADVLDKVYGVKVAMNEWTFLSAYSYPLKGMLLVNGEKEDVTLYKNKALYLSHFKQIVELSKGVKDCGIWSAKNILDLETMLCKYHSYAHNRYKIGEDIVHIRKILADDRLKRYRELVP